MPPVPREVLYRHWVHSHEEDTPEHMVFRPAGYGFPPSRGRRAFELRPDGTLAEAGPGPDDRPTGAEGRWDLHEDGVLELEAPGGKERLEIAEADPDRLVVRPT
jgi:hypothetical protein